MERSGWDSVSDLKVEDVIQRGAIDGLFWSYYFLPKTFGLDPAIFHEEMWSLIDDLRFPYLNLEVFRDGAKTTLARAATLRRIAYGISNTALFLSESSTHSKRSLRWIRTRITEAGPVKNVYGLRIGAKDNENELEIINDLFGTKTYIFAQGITGQIRGLNEDDNRPDFIICDDIASFESFNTEEALEKVNQIFFGAVVGSLCSRSLNKHSKVLHIGTRSGVNDVISKCEEDSQWENRKFPVFLANGESAWPTKWTREQLLIDKQSAIDRNMLSTWMREKECKLVMAETTAFKPTWLNIYISKLQNTVKVIGLDPVPPPSDRQIREGLKKKDFEVFTVLGLCGRDYFIEEQRSNKGHEINWTLHTAFELIYKYHPRAIGIESIAYQRTIAKQLSSAMKERGTYTQVVEIDDHRSKYHRITGELAGPASHRVLHVQQGCIDFIEQFNLYPGTQHDDFLDSAAIAFLTLKAVMGHLTYDEQSSEDMKTLIEREKNIPDLPEYGGCP